MAAEDLTIKQVTDAADAMVAMSTSAISHTLEYINEPDHSCGFTVDDLKEGDVVPDFDDWDVQVILAFEDAMMEQFKFLRTVLIKQGYDVSEEVSH